MSDLRNEIDINNKKELAAISTLSESQLVNELTKLSYQYGLIANVDTNDFNMAQDEKSDRLRLFSSVVVSKNENAVSEKIIYSLNKKIDGFGYNEEFLFIFEIQKLLVSLLETYKCTKIISKQDKSIPYPHFKSQDLFSSFNHFASYNDVLGNLFKDQQSSFYGRIRLEYSDANFNRIRLKKMIDIFHEGKNAVLNIVNDSAYEINSGRILYSLLSAIDIELYKLIMKLPRSLKNDLVKSSEIGKLIPSINTLSEKEFTLTEKIISQIYEEYSKSPVEIYLPDLYPSHIDELFGQMEKNPVRFTKARNCVLSNKMNTFQSELITSKGTFQERAKNYVEAIINSITVRMIKKNIDKTCDYHSKDTNDLPEFKEFILKRKNKDSFDKFVKNKFSSKEHKELLICIDEYLSTKLFKKKINSFHQKITTLNTNNNLNDFPFTSIMHAYEADKEMPLDSNKKQEKAMLAYEAQISNLESSKTALEEELKSITKVLDEIKNLEVEEKQKKANEFYDALIANGKILKEYSNDSLHDDTRGQKILDALFE